MFAVLRKGYLDPDILWPIEYVLVIGNSSKNRSKD